MVNHAPGGAQHSETSAAMLPHASAAASICAHFDEEQKRYPRIVPAGMRGSGAGLAVRNLDGCGGVGAAREFEPIAEDHCVVREPQQSVLPQRSRSAIQKMRERRVLWRSCTMPMEVHARRARIHPS